MTMVKFNQMVKNMSYIDLRLDILDISKITTHREIVEKPIRSSYRELPQFGQCISDWLTNLH